MKFVSNRNITVASTLGHAVRFQKGVPTLVPRALWPEVIAVGAVPEDEIDLDGPTKGTAPTNPGEREALILEAFEALLLKADREDFTAGGIPHSRAVKDFVGFSIDVRERDAAWQKFQAAQDAKADQAAADAEAAKAAKAGKPGKGA